MLMNTGYVFFVYNFEAFLVLRRTGPRWKMYVGLHVKYPLFLSDFNEA